ncbi:helix-turn-helix domain-containing protein [Paenibacillus sp. CF384]|uniref:helix-turn-helix domain-containing protein n=1 Tax=Paenibacillus sp. CF384 TaxID=1884382 RepID=UPI000895CC6D|nr:helix-turn-helix domain-containing protein [Paenibacillus sp. CF384]SDW17827.1 two-component system, response regulator YesN [Paenibacillus sp. CF384]
MLSEGLLYKDDVILTWMRDRFLQDLVLGLKPKSTNLKDSLSRLNLNPYFTYPALALLEPSSSNLGEQEKVLLEEMRDYLQQQIAVHTGSIVFMDDQNRLALLFSWVSKSDLETLQTKLSRQFSLQVNIAVGNPCSQLNDIKQSYKQAVCALQEKFYRGTGHIIYFSELPEYLACYDYPADKELELHEAIKSADSADEIEEAVEDFYHAMLEQGPVDIKSMYELTARLLIGTEKKLLTSTNYDSAYNKLEIMSIVKMHTLQEIKQYVCAFLSGVREVLSYDQKESHRSIIKKTIHHMEQEYQALSLQSVAQKVYMTPTYLSLLFKLNTGKTFIEHLTDIRIEKAKKLLVSTHYKNYEVAEQVGYQDPRYFSQIFKKKVGVSPTEYRETTVMN